MSDSGRESKWNALYRMTCGCYIDGWEQLQRVPNCTNHPSSFSEGASLAALQQKLAQREHEITEGGEMRDSLRDEIAVLEQRLAEVTRHLTEAQGQCCSFRDAYDRESQWRAAAEAAKEAAEATIATLREAMERKNRTIGRLRGECEPHITNAQQAEIAADVFARLQASDAALAAPAAGTPAKEDA